MTLTALTRLAGVLASAFAVTTIGCSDSPPTPAQGASHVVLQYNANTACPVSGSNSWSIPEGSLTNSTTVGSQVVDGSGDANVSCTVKAAGGGFSVSGSLTTPTLSFSVSAGNLSPGSGGNAFEGTANVSQYAGNILMTLKGSDCTITVSQTQGAQIGPGKIWADFDCPTFNPTSAATGGCAANGTFVFGNCAD